MDKETLSNYGWIVICVLVLAVMIALATPFGTFVSDAVKSTTQGLFDVNQSALNSTGLINIDGQEFESCPHDYEVTATTANCTTAGTTTHTCKLCGKSYSEETPAGHKYDDTGLTCTQCGVTVVEYSFSPSDYDAKMGTTTATDTNVVIPETFEYNGKTYKVTKIASTAFKSNSNIVSVHIPKTVTTIENDAFYMCTNLISITFADNSNLTTIKSHAFGNCKALTDITLPESTTTLGTQTFYNCTSLKRLYIPSGLTGDLTGDTFYICTGIEEIVVSPDNPVYHSQGNCLIKTATKELLFGCKNSVIPDDGSVTSIGGKRAFAQMTHDNLIIPDTITSITLASFEYCAMTKVTFVNPEGWHNTSTKDDLENAVPKDVSNPTKNPNTLRSGYWYQILD